MARILSLRERLLAKLDELAAKGGSFNDLFRPVAEGKIQCPKTGNGVSWTKFITRMCANLPAGTNIGDNKCWKLKYNQWKITEQRSGKTKLLASVLITRFLALLENPTELNLTQLRETKDLPFSHYCAKGLKDSAGRYCVNGIEHGAITTRTENESRKKCTFGARCLCQHVPKCIFVHEIGSLKPCLMCPTHVPLCECVIRCYPLSV